MTKNVKKMSCDHPVIGNFLINGCKIESTKLEMCSVRVLYGYGTLGFQHFSVTVNL